MLRSLRITAETWAILTQVVSGDPCKIKMMTISRLHDGSNLASHVCLSLQVFSLKTVKISTEVRFRRGLPFPP